MFALTLSKPAMFWFSAKNSAGDRNCTTSLVLLVAADEAPPRFRRLAIACSAVLVGRVFRLCSRLAPMESAEAELRVEVWVSLMRRSQGHSNTSVEWTAVWTCLCLSHHARFTVLQGEKGEYTCSGGAE